MICFGFLGADPRIRLLGHRRQLFGRAGNLNNAGSNAIDQLMKVEHHLLKARLQLAQLIAPGHRHMLGQITPGNAVHRLERVLQWIDDLPCDHPCGERAEQQRQGRDEAQRGLGGRGIRIAFGVLRLNQLCVVSSNTSPN